MNGQYKNINIKSKKSVKSKNKVNVITNLEIRKPHMPLLYKKKFVKEWMDSNITNITPKKSNNNIVYKIPKKILDTINQDVQKDLKELFDTYQYQLWTATSLMTGRILENVLKIHITHDLKEKSVNDISDAIKILEKHKYNQNTQIRQ